MKHIHILFDSNNAAWRADSVTELYLQDGTRTSAIVGVLKIFYSSIDVLSQKEDAKVSEAIAVWDWGHSKRRTTLYPEYKKKEPNPNMTEREKKDKERRYQDFIKQSNTLRDNLPLFGIKSFAVRGWEADDLIYGVSKEITENHPDDTVVIVSTDEDYLQLLTDRVHVYSPVKQIMYTPQTFYEMKGMPVNTYIDWKILVGDSSDNIDGIHGIGPKTATNLVNTYGGIDGILANRVNLLKSKRTAAIFTPQGMMTLFRNEKLINLPKYVDLSEVHDQIVSLCDEPPFFASKEARQFLMKYHLTSILMDWNQWSDTLKSMVDEFSV